jgi:prepilin-type N-terminal cleavage/methylation domain-containing protein
MKQQRFSTSPRSIEGFTLLEILVVVILIGIMFAIGAPSWVAFINNQRVGTVRNQVFETLRTAQAEARRTKVNRAVVLDNNNNQPRIAIIPVQSDSITVSKSDVQNWQVLGNGEIKPGMIKASSSPASTQGFDASVLFDTYGNIIKTDNKPLPTDTGYKITVGVANSAAPRRCLIVKTLLGAIQDGSNSDCN